MAGSRSVVEIGRRLKELRQDCGLKPEELEQRLILGPGWVSSFESGEAAPKLDLLLAILGHLGVEADDFFRDLEIPSAGAVMERNLFAVADGPDLLIHFRYAEHDAAYRLSNATLDEFESVLQELRDGLSPLAGGAATGDEAIKTGAVASTFAKAAQTWPGANPSDLWWFVVYRAYCDPFNHPARFARLDLAQSWKRTGGWALEEVMVRFYGPFLKRNGVNIFAGHGERKERLLAQLRVTDRVEPDKVDVLLSGMVGDEEVCFGVVHVKSSFAERRTDDVPLSRTLVEGGYASPLWTMDCKSTPGKSPVNKGELGAALSAGRDRRSAKRKDIEDDGYFSACFSYNQRTVPTPDSQRAMARVVVCNFKDPDDAFSRFIVAAWKGFRRGPVETGGRR